MWTVFDQVRDISLLSVSVRMLFVLLCGGIVGLEREFKRRPAGFRTHILICLGAAITTMTGEYLFLNLGYYTDISRLGAQVVAGIGFIGAGTIIMNRERRIKGLTTAAGIWVSAIVGLCIGAGFYEGGLIATILILMAEIVFSRLEHRVMHEAPEIRLHINYQKNDCLERILAICQAGSVKVVNIKVSKKSADTSGDMSATFYLLSNNPDQIEQVTQEIKAIAGIRSVTEV